MMHSGRIPIIALLALAAPAFAQSATPQTAPWSSGLGAGPTAGFVATGTVTAYGAVGTPTGPNTISVWGARHCSVTIDFPQDAKYLLVANPRGATTTRSPGFGDLPSSGSDNACDLLPQGLILADFATGRVLLRNRSHRP